MTATHRNIGGGQIFCLSATFDHILRNLSVDYFSELYDQLTKILQSLSISPMLEVGWMHPGYACTALNSDIPSLCEPGGLFGWVTQSQEADFYEDIPSQQKLLELCSNQRLQIQWATSSARLFCYKDVPPNDFEAILNLYSDFAVDEPSDWSGPAVSPDRTVPADPWRRICFAAAIDDPELERQAWTIAINTYTPPAITLLRRGIENTRRCVNWS